MTDICTPSTIFKNVSTISEELMLNSIEANLKMFLDWGFLNIGGWFDVSINENTIQNNLYDRLVPSEDKSYPAGKAWDGVRKDWVWEQNISFNNKSPVAISSILVNNTSIPNDNSQYIVNYPLGRIIFNNPLPANSVVKAAYSYRYVQVYRANDSEWFNIIQNNGLSTNKPINRLTNGSWKIGNNHTVQLPAIVIEALPKSRSKPHEIGSGGLILEQDFAFHILADSKNDRNKLVDILRLQQDLTIWLFNINALLKDNKYPLNYNGSLKNNPIMYPTIVAEYPWKKCWLKNINVYDVESVDPNMHRAAVKVTAEIIYT